MGRRSENENVLVGRVVIEYLRIYYSIIGLEGVLMDKNLLIVLNLSSLFWEKKIVGEQIFLWSSV